MRIQKYLDWKGYFEGLYLNWIKALTTTLMALLGTNGAEKMGVQGIGMNWKQAGGMMLSITFWEVIKYLNSKPKPDVVTQEVDTATIGKSPLWIIGFCLVLAGCAGFSTTVSETVTAAGTTNKVTKVKAHTFFDSKSELANVKAGQLMHGSQEVKLGSLNQESSGTNAASLIEGIVGAAVKAAIKP